MVLVAERIWPWAWRTYLGVAVIGFAILEWAAYRCGKHPTLSRELHAWLQCKRHPWSALLFVALGAWMAHHLHELKELS
jgi:hypothetical protein